MTVYFPVPGLSFGVWVVFLSAVACGIQFPHQGSNLVPVHWEHGVSATGPPEKSLCMTLEIHGHTFRLCIYLRVKSLGHRIGLYYFFFSLFKKKFLFVVDFVIH